MECLLAVGFWRLGWSAETRVTGASFQLVPVGRPLVGSRKESLGQM
jgi:hypothetical protein